MINGKIEPGAAAVPDHMGPVGAVAAPNGAVSLPGCHWLFAAGDGEGRVSGGFGVLCITHPFSATGLHVTLSTDGLQHFARQFDAMADGLEAAASREAAAALNKAAGK